ncbi:phosphoadenosine phosphosulfate reductase domain-containing protein [Diplocloster modestus]|nr:phosphoadenosine phosphosulfate reductase family protein [Diplocloster modestus]
MIAVLLSGGKDSIACYYKLLELGVPKEKIEFWHHDIDGGHPCRRMDWRCTQSYVRAFAEAEDVPLRLSWRVNGFFGELYRVGASEPVEWMEPDTGEIRQCKLSRNYLKCMEIKKKATEDMEEQLKEYGYRMKFPMKTGDLSRRWCSAYLKIMVADAVVSNLSRTGELEQIGGKCHKFPAKGSIGNGRWCSAQLKREVADTVIRNLDELGENGDLDKTRRDVRVLVVSGERRGESAGRSKYNEMEIHRTNATAKAHRRVHQWRPVIDYSEKDVWEVLKRHRVNPHPCYRAGWNRCSCAMCIFSTPPLFAGIRELYPEDFELLKQDERILGFTLDNKCDLDTFVGDAKSCVYHGDTKAIHSLVTGDFKADDIYVTGDWMYPAGAFHGAEGGPC